MMASEKHSGQERDEEFLALFTASQRRLHAYILALVFDPSAAADILQETNIVLWQKFDQFEIGTNFFGWAREIARIAVLRYRKRSSRRIVAIDPHLLEELALGFAGDIQSVPSDEEEALEHCLKKLRAVDHQLILARYGSDCGVSKIADNLDRTANSVSQSLRRIRHGLLQCIQRELKGAARE